MNPIEQQIADAAPRVQPSTFPADVEQVLSSHDVESLGPGEVRHRRRRGALWRRVVYTLTTFSLLAAGVMGVGAIGTATLPEHQNSDVGGPSPGASAAPSPAPLQWRTATLISPWADEATAVEASIDLPATWSVRRHDPSAAYPGLHVTVLDADSLPAATLYFGPAVSAFSCPLRPGSEVLLQQGDVTTGAELLDPALAGAFSYGISAGPEPRGSFGLGPRISAGDACGGSVLGSPQLILRFGDVLGLDTPGHAATGPRSIYARTFSSTEEARSYLGSQEFNTLKRLVTSLKFSFPEDRSRLWQLPDHRHPTN